MRVATGDCRGIPPSPRTAVVQSRSPSPAALVTAPSPASPGRTAAVAAVGQGRLVFSPMTVIAPAAVSVALAFSAAPSSPADRGADSSVAPGPAPAAAVPAEVAWPLTPRPEVVHRFAPPPRRWMPGHRGVDLAGRAGQPVLAVAAGRISFAGRVAGRGVVVVDHGPTRTTYEPVHAEVDVGAAVSAGARLGLLAPAGGHCGAVPCLHLGWRRGEEYLDPLDLLGGGPRPVRLLP